MAKSQSPKIFEFDNPKVFGTMSLMSGDKFLAWHEYSRIAQNCFGFNRNWDIPWQMVRSIMFESLQGNVWFMELIGHVARGPPIFWLQICHPQRWDGFFILNDRIWGKEGTQWLAQLNSNWMRQAYKHKCKEYEESLQSREQCITRLVIYQYACVHFTFDHVGFVWYKQSYESEQNQHFFWEGWKMVEQGRVEK